MKDLDCEYLSINTLEEKICYDKTITLQGVKSLSEILPIIVPVASSLKSINFYLVKGNDSLVLIDAGLNNTVCWNTLNDTLHNNGFDLSDLSHILLTHHHNDHVGLVNPIISKHSIPVYAHPLSFPRLRRCDKFIQMRIDFFDQLYQEMGCGKAGTKQVEHLRKAANSNLAQRLECDLFNIFELPLKDFDIVEIPGHAPDQVAFFNRKKRQLLSGDLLINHISSNALVEPNSDGKRTHSLAIHVESLRKCFELPADTVYPGHGELIKNHRKLIQKRLEGVERKAEKFLALIQSGRRTASEVAETYYKDIYKKQFSLVMSEVIGHLDLLEEQGKVEKTIKNGIWEYKIT